MATDVRAAAAKALADVLAGQSLNQALTAQLDNVTAKDRALLQQLCYGTARHGPRLEALLAQLLDKPFRDKDSDVKALLLCGLYQLDELRIPDHAAVAATVGATKALKKPWARGVSNAILRRYLRERESLASNLDTASAANHPTWLYDKITAQWPEAAAGILASNNNQGPMTLRVNVLRLPRSDYSDALKEKSIASTLGVLSEQAIVLDSAMDVLELPGFDDGQISVQDEAAQMAAALLPVAAGERVLDACAAPGGKACHLLELHPTMAELVIMDIEATRLDRVNENLSRLNLAATVMCGDGTAPPAELLPASFDHLLIDAPCSASGVIRRHPDVKWLRRETDIEQFAEQQLQILKGLWPLLKKDGCLLYVTCSIFDEENDQVIERFLAEEEGAQADTINVNWGQVTTHGRQLLPSLTGTDGMFFARLRKSS